MYLLFGAYFRLQFECQKDISSELYSHTDKLINKQPAVSNLFCFGVLAHLCVPTTSGHLEGAMF